MQPPGRAANAFPLGADPGLGLALGLAALLKDTHLTRYSYRVRRASNVALLEHLGRRCREVNLHNGHGRVQPGLPHHPPPRRTGPARRALRRLTLPADPIGTHLLRPGPRLHRDGLRQRRPHQSRTSPRGDHLRRILAARRRLSPRTAGLRLLLRDEERDGKPSSSAILTAILGYVQSHGVLPRGASGRARYRSQATINKPKRASGYRSSARTSSSRLRTGRRSGRTIRTTVCQCGDLRGG